MYRPPRPLDGVGVGVGGGGYSHPPNYLPQNPNFPLHLNPQYHQRAPPFPLQPYFQNPNLQNPNFQHSNFQNPNFQNPFLQTPPPPPNPSLNPQAILERVENAVAKAHRDLVAAGGNVSAWKVSQSALVSLNADSWSSLGFQMQGVPSLRRLLIIEGKVNAFIHCFVGAQRITSLYDLEASICKNEGVEKFEELGMGPLLCHPLAEHYFSVPSDSLEVFKISSEDIVASLLAYVGKFDKMKISADEFLDFLAEQKSVLGKERLGVRIQSLGLHLSYIREAKKAEETILKKSLEVNKHNIDKSSGRMERVSSGRLCNACMRQQKQMLDKRFDFISDRVKSFSSGCGVFGGKHIRIDDSSDGDSVDCDDDGEDLNVCSYQSSSHANDSSQRMSSCPYPSTAEEKMRLGLKSEIGERVSSSTDKILASGDKSSCKKRKRKSREMNNGDKSSCKKRNRKSREKNDGARFFNKLPKKEKAIHLGNKKTSFRLTLTSDRMQKFITTWKEACREHSLADVFDMMVNFYTPTIKPKTRTMIGRVFSSFPGIALLNIAVASIERGSLDSIYDTFQVLGEHGFINAASTPSTDMIEIGPPAKEDSILNTNDSTDKCGYSVTVDDIILNVAKYFGLDLITPREKVVSSGKQFATLKKFHDCEMWLTSQFSVKDFSSLGHGDFFRFLEHHASLLPNELHTFLNGGSSGHSFVEVSMLKQQLEVLLSQAKNNVMDKGDIAKSDVCVFLKKQFPTVSFHIVGNEPDKCLLDLIKRQKNVDNSHCVLYSSALLGNWTGNFAYCGRFSSEVIGMKTEAHQQTDYRGNISSEDAIACLLKAPMLSDLLSWSHWDLIYAPSLGPLPEWLLNEVSTKELLCIATVDGKLIRIDHSATIDEFLEAMIQQSSSQVALKLLSLLSLYRGVNSAPVSLLKCYALRAVDIIIRNSAEALNIHTSEETVMHKNAIPQQATLGEAFNNTLLNPVGTSEAMSRSLSSESLSDISKTIVSVSRFILECLSYLPSEFRSFGSEILVSGLRSADKDASKFILRECRQADQRLMLHDIGLSLGITEWIDDYHEFSSADHADLLISSMTLNKTHPLSSASGGKLNHAPDKSEKPGSDTDKMPAQIVTDASDAKHGSYDEVDVREDDDTLANHRGICRRQDSGAVSVNRGMSEDRAVQDATYIIESIRREEFGLDPNLNYTESCMLKKQHARLGRALHCLSQELYSQDSHLLLELIQNADDNIYPEDVDPTLVFILQEDGIVVLNNEQGFSAQNIRALCDIGNSTKKGLNAGYIGHKGIGFKSVFRVTDAPEIHSNGFHVKFDITEGQIGFVLPTVIPSCNINMFSKQLSGETYDCDDNHWNTCIVLPFRSKSREGTGVTSIISMFSDLHPSLLLFLHRLRCIKFRNMLNETLINMRREILGNGIVKVSHGQDTMTWLVINKKLHASMIRPDVQNTEIAVAFTLQESEDGDYKPHLSQQPVFSFLPLRNYGLKFILQGDFVLPSSREGVDGDSAWNQWLLSEFPALFVSAEQSFCSLPCFQNNPGKAVTTYMSFVPLGGEVHGFFSHLPHMIISKLRMSNCLLLDGPDLTWVLPCRVLRGWNEQARLLLSDSLLEKYLGLGYLCKDVELSDALGKALGIQDYGPKVLVEVISSICHTNGDIKSLGLDWLSSWLNLLHTTLSAHSSAVFSRNGGMEFDLINSLRKIPFIPLSDGSYSSLADGPIWLPWDALGNGFEGNESAKDFPSLYARLRTINPLLFAVGAANIYNMEETRGENIIHMLHKVGVQQLSPHEVIKSHILVDLAEGKSIYEDKNLMVEYLSFIMIHFQYDCVRCSFEKKDIMSELRKRTVLLTNHGCKCPIDEPVHFSKEYDNPVDMDKLIGVLDVKWLEVDAAYLKHPSTRSLPFGLTKWRNFFQELGVTDFVQVTCINKTVLDVSYTPHENMICDGDNVVGTSIINDWESPELLNFLSIYSSKKCREKCIYLLEVLDKMWDDFYSANSRSCIKQKTEANETKRTIESSFMKSIREFEWIASSMDQQLHFSKDLFYDCEDVRCIMGTLVPYAVPQVNSKLLLKDIGLKTEVLLDDALEILQSLRMSRDPFMASILQMSRFYTFISDGLIRSKAKISEELQSSCFIFIPFLSNSRYTDVVSGIFLSPKELYWHDPTGCLHKIKEMIFLSASKKEIDVLTCKALGTIYPGLHDFFVNVCGVREIPPFASYLQILLQLSSVALPSHAAHVVFQVFLKWADDVKSGLVKSEEILDLKENLLKLENTVLPTLDDKWVSLHPSFGFICWSDNEELKQQFKYADGINFVDFGELSKEDKEMLSGSVAMLMHDLGVPALSEAISREPVFYGIVKSREKASLVSWILPYAQRYLYNLYPHIYISMKQLGFEKLSQLQVVVVDKLFYKHSLRGRGSTSKKRFECSCLLQGDILYTTLDSDYHSIFLELSRLFFNGSSELQFANFLHMVTTMAESGSTNEQIEFFIVNSQQVPKLPVAEPVWCLSSVLERPVDEIQPAVLASRMNIEPNIPVASQRKAGSTPSWPPTDWKTAPDSNYARANYRLTNASHISHPCLPKDSNLPLGAFTQTEDVLLVPVEIEGDWLIEEAANASNTLGMQDPPTTDEQPKLVGSAPNNVIGDSVVGPGIERDRLSGQVPDENQCHKTGRIGEAIAYKYFAQKLGSGNVKWVNEETETGLPYDLINLKDESCSEYIEVKATRSARKDWFEITTREWQFAVEKGDSYSIAHVVLLGPKKASITVLKNPSRLCQQNALQLAVVMSRCSIKSLPTAECHLSLG